MIACASEFRNTVKMPTEKRTEAECKALDKFKKCEWARDCAGTDQSQCVTSTNSGASAVHYADTSSVLKKPIKSLNAFRDKAKASLAEVATAKFKAYGDGRGNKYQRNLYNLEELMKCGNEDGQADTLSSKGWLNVEKTIASLRSGYANAKKKVGRKCAEIVGLIINRKAFDAFKKRYVATKHSTGGKAVPKNHRASLARASLEIDDDKLGAAITDWLYSCKDTASQGHLGKSLALWLKCE